MTRGEAEAAIADYYRSDAMPTRDAAIGVPEELSVVMRVEVDKARRDVHSGRVEDFMRA